jgi:hypothetical protein
MFSQPNIPKKNRIKVERGKDSFITEKGSAVDPRITETERNLLRFKDAIIDQIISHPVIIGKYGSILQGSNETGLAYNKYIYYLAYVSTDKNHSDQQLQFFLQNYKLPNEY